MLWWDRVWWNMYQKGESFFNGLAMDFLGKNHPHLVFPMVMIPLNISLLLSLLAITLCKSFRRHTISAQSWGIYIFVGESTLGYPCIKVYRRMPLMSSSLAHQQCPACLILPICIVCVMGGKWLYSCINFKFLLPNSMYHLCVVPIKLFSPSVSLELMW